MDFNLAVWAVPLVMVILHLWDRHEKAKAQIADSAGLTAADRAEIKRIGKLDDALTKHLLECARKDGRVEETLKNLSTDVTALSNQVGSMEATIRNVVLGRDNTVIVRNPRIEP